MNLPSIARTIRLLTIVTVLALTLAAVPALAQIDPVPPADFTATDWSQAVAKDPAVHLVTTSGTPAVADYDVIGAAGAAGAAGANGTIVSGDTTVRYGRLAIDSSHHEWFAAVGLEVGADREHVGWLLYIRGSTQHVAYIPGDDLGFTGGYVVTATRDRSSLGERPNCCPKHKDVAFWAYSKKKFVELKSLALPNPVPYP